MLGQLTNFRVEGLHGIRTTDVKIVNNRLILVGENGTGKSTITNLIYFFLTQQWERMLAYKFKSISAVIDSKEITFNYEEVAKTRRIARHIHEMPARFETLIRQSLNQQLNIRSVEEILSNRNEMRHQASLIGLPLSVYSDYLQYLIGMEVGFSDNFDELKSTLDKMDISVLFLPTYRRIEQDISTIFPKIAAEVKDEIQRLKRRSKELNYVELVEFGMEDVVDTLTTKMEELRKKFLNDYTNLTGTYLRDVILGTYRSAESLNISELDENTIDAVFNQIDKTVLPEQLQTSLRNTIREIKRSDTIQENDRVVVHFFTKLIDLYKAQRENERDVQAFVKVCNGYLSGKKIVYDNLKFEIYVRLEDEHERDKEEERPEPIQMKWLSSGEKQIISLFSQIYLSSNSNYFVIIDEPELSLSVYWQKRFLPDILATNKCRGLIATTHSPFIFENELESSTHLLDEFTEPFNVNA